MVCLFCAALAQCQWLADLLIFVWQWHNSLPILFVAVAQWLADLVVWQWHNGLPILVVAVAQWLAGLIVWQWHNVNGLTILFVAVAQ
jgi:hypothetical protein